MATINPTRVDRNDGGVVITWAALVNATSDVGQGVFIGDLVDVAVQAVGTNATTVEIEGSNSGDDYNDLGAGQTLTIGASGSSPVQNILARALFIRPATPSAGANTDVILSGYRRGT
jgi:hypothetical protein